MADQLNLFDSKKPSGWDLALLGMAKAIEHAERDHPGWRKAALKLVYAYAQSFPGQELTCEMVRLPAEKEGFPIPPDKRAWGAIMKSANSKKCGIIERVGDVSATDPKVHRNKVTLWRSLY